MLYFFKRLFPFFVLFVVIQTLFKTVIYVYELHNIDWSIVTIFKTILIGLLFDIATTVYFLIPFSFFFLFMPKKIKGKILDKSITLVLFAIALFVMLLQLIASWLFWQEFSAMFNFVAVDYLVYTHEVINNIRESYPINFILSIIFIVSLLVSFLLRKYLITKAVATSFFKRLQGFALLIVLCVLSFFFVDFKYSNVSKNSYNVELAKDPLFSFFHAYWANELDYNRFYLTSNQQDNLNFLRQKLKGKDTEFIDSNNINRKIKVKGKTKTPNVVFVLMESEGANWLTQNRAKGEPILSPNLDKLAQKSLFFKNTYAIGTRTVFGIQATTISTPPLPGEAITRRYGYENLNGIGNVFKQHGYSNQFIYGGYSTFDNMRNYFSNNGFDIVDRLSFNKDEITVATVWGVSDEDLYRKSIKEANSLYNKGKPFFQYILTTSNHRPYVYPNGRIDIPSKTGRDGAVKYADYAVGYFLKEASKTKWFNNTIFVFIGDHQASVAGKSEVNRDKYPIVFMMYSANKELIKTQVVTKNISQIDAAPTLLALLNFSYVSSFMGENVLSSSYKERYFVSNYQKVAYVENDYMVVLKPNKELSVYDTKTNKLITDKSKYEKILKHAISYFQVASTWYSYLHVNK